MDKWIEFFSWDNKCIPDREYLITDRGRVAIARYVAGDDMSGYFDGYPYASAYMEKPAAFIEGYYQEVTKIPDGFNIDDLKTKNSPYSKWLE